MRRMSLLGAAALAPLVCSAQLLTNQEAGYFSRAFWAAELPTLDLNPAGTNNGKVPLPGSPSFASGATFVSPFAGAGGTIDVVWFSETAGWTGNDLYLTNVVTDPTPATPEQIVNNANAPSNPEFGTSQLYDVSIGFDVVVDPLNQLPDTFSLLDGTNPDRFFWSLYTTTDGVYDYYYYIFGVEDKSEQSDEDFSDLVFAVGFRSDSDFVPPDGVPEPSTYGLAGAALLAGFIWRAHRRRRSLNPS